MLDKSVFDRYTNAHAERGVRAARAPSALSIAQGCLSHHGASGERRKRAKWMEERIMAVKKAKPGEKALTKSKIVETLAAESGLKKKEVGTVLETLAELAYAQAVVGFTVPGIGKLVVVQRKARTGRNPATGETINIPAKKVLRFRIAKQAKDAITPKKAK
jgi:DNA-binding protein HU-beta